MVMKLRRPYRWWTLILALGIGLGFPGLIEAADYYVATNATPSSPYNTWSGAYTNPQDALNAARNGDTVYLAGHMFALTNQLVWANATNVTLRGGMRRRMIPVCPGAIIRRHGRPC